ncbi:hypothetical protein SAY86_008386 [Trapa natans]|uniref:Uncharacterized protein n=1 Tax=Trapa natans TaxID=22666 RepID=A0AAN7QAV4_TRANT|nr:hypothetical protein SAY86_008386 [Trapa natans]
MFSGLEEMGSSEFQRTVSIEHRRGTRKHGLYRPTIACGNGKGKEEEKNSHPEEDRTLEDLLPDLGSSRPEEEDVGVRGWWRSEASEEEERTLESRMATSAAAEGSSRGA